MKWANAAIGEHCEITSSKRIFYSEYVDSGVPFYRSKEIIEKSQGQQISEPLYISVQKFNEIKAKFGVPMPDDMLLTSVGTIGIPYLVTQEDYFYFKDGNLTWFRNFDEYLLPRFLYYWIGSKEGYAILNNTTIGSSQKALTISALKQIKCPLPPLETQRRIASILSVYDDLIENNRKQIKLLEEAAQRLYKEWFVDLRFPGWETAEIVDGVPVGWRNSLIKDTIEYEIGGGWGEEEVKEQCEIPAFVIRGTDLYGVTHGDFLSVPYRFHKKSNLESRKLQNGDIIFEVSGGSKTEGVARTTRITAALLGQFSSPVMCASFCKLVRPKAELSQLLYNHFVFLRASGKTSEYDKKSASSIVNYRWKDFLVQESVLIPSNEILVQYNQCANSIYEKIVTCSIIVEKAKATRDRLLSKLMSGELEV